MDFTKALVIWIALSLSTVVHAEDSVSDAAGTEAVHTHAESSETGSWSIDVPGGSGAFTTPKKKGAPAIDYQAIAKAAREGCASPQTNAPITVPTAVVDLDVFYVIPGNPRADWLPPIPINPDATIHGIDADGDCVRDDIEHYIVRRYRQDSQYKLRKYLYEYAAWLDRFLIQGLSENTAKTAYRNMAAAGECVSRIIGDSAANKAIDDLFARFHNTVPRSYRYLENLKRTSGWTTRETIPVSCP